MFYLYGHSMYVSHIDVSGYGTREDVGQLGVRFQSRDSDIQGPGCGGLTIQAEDVRPEQSDGGMESRTKTQSSED